MHCTRQLDSLQSEAYDDSSYDPVVTLHHTGRENRAMASVFSSHAASLHDSSDRDDQLTQLSRPRSCFHSPHHIHNSSVTVEPIRLPRATIMTPVIRHALHPFMEPRRMTPSCP
jgi:hypothetical protein